MLKICCRVYYKMFCSVLCTVCRNVNLNLKDREKEREIWPHDENMLQGVLQNVLQCALQCVLQWTPTPKIERKGERSDPMTNGLSLTRTATRCNTLQHAATRCNTQKDLTSSRILIFSLTWLKTLRYSMFCGSTRHACRTSCHTIFKH